MNMRLIISLWLVASSVWAAPVVVGKDRLVTLDLEPAPAPSPALKYQLLPELSEMQPGNCIPQYLKCFSEQNNFFFKKESVDERERLIACPLTDIKKGSLQHYGGSAVRQAHYAARSEICDWNLLPKIREDGYHLLLPDLQQMRTLAGAVVVRCRGAIVDGDFDMALTCIKTLLGMGRHMCEHPTLIGGLVGMAIMQLGLNCMEEMIQQPKAPNLYWALSFAPSPFVDLRRPLSGERMLLETSFGHLMNPNRRWSADDVAEASKIVRDVVNDIGLGERSKEADAWLSERLKDNEWLSVSRQLLVKNGYLEEKVKTYPPEQVLLYRLFLKARIHRDDSLKLMVLPYWQVDSALEESAKKPEDIEGLICSSLGFAGVKVRIASVRLEQRLAAYRIVEAVRMHGASHGGKLPAKLDDINLPLPVDPASGKAFEYKVDGLTAMLAGKPIRSNDSFMQYRYELRLRK